MYNFSYEMAAESYQDNPVQDLLRTFAKDSAENKSMENLLNPRSVGERVSETQDGLAFVIDTIDQLEEAGRYDLLATDDDDLSEEIDPETGLPYLDETEELSEEDMETAAYVWSHEDKIVDADIEQYFKDKANQQNVPTHAQGDESK